MENWQTTDKPPSDKLQLPEVSGAKREKSGCIWEDKHPSRLDAERLYLCWPTPVSLSEGYTVQI